MWLYYLIFGYVCIGIERENVAEAVTALIRRGLCARVNENGIMKIPFLKRRKYENALKNIPHTVVSSGGAPIVFLRNKRRYGVFAALALSVGIHIFLSFFIWDIRIVGNESISDTKIFEELANVGFEIGNKWREAPFSEIEVKMLEKSDTIGWININRRGCVAYVEVKEKTVYNPENEKMAFLNIVASCDSVIEEITVRSGVACVKVGDTVKKGELLISGILPKELGGGFVAADGDVIGRVVNEISVEVSRNESAVSYGDEELYSAKIKILKFSINIFKKYRKIDNTCAIIEDVKECTLFGKYRIPITLERIYVTEKIKNQSNYNDAQLMSIASLRLAELRFMRLSDAELLKIKTCGDFTEHGYKMTSYVTILKNIGESRVFAE